MKFSSLTVRIENHIADIVLHQPEKANAMDKKAWSEFKEVFSDVDENEAVKVVVLSGEGKHFCSGIDLSLLATVLDQGRDECPGKSSEALRKMIVDLQSAVNKIVICQKPVIAAVHGGCIGAGLDMAAACDMRYCTSDAFFTLKEVDMAMVADLGSLQRLPGIIAEGTVREMAYTGRNVSAQEALRIGLVNQVFENKSEMMEVVKKIAATISQKSPLAIRGIKNVLNLEREKVVSQGLDYTATWNAGMLVSNDLKEALNAFKDKRPPSFK